MFMETVGPTSKCVDFEIMTNWEYNSTTIPPIYGGACYEVCMRAFVCVRACVRACVCVCVPAAVLVVHVMANGWKLYILQVSCASKGEVAITVGQNEVLCHTAGQQVSNYKCAEAPINGTVFA